jgi:DNA repair exonuclease SbcCD ATPase subunit
MIEFVSVSLRNFLSYGNNNTIFLLQRPGTTLIMGEDMDNTVNGKGGNGCGKTTLINAIVFALYDKAISDVTKDNLVNNINKKNMEVCVEFVIGLNKYVVKRERKTKGIGNIYLYVNDEDKTLDSAAQTNAEIVRILGMPYELFVRIVVFSAAQEPFLSLPVRHPTKANQTDFIEELFGLTTLSAKAELLKLQITDTDRSLTTAKSKITALEQEHSRHALQIESAKRRVVTWEAANQQTITKLQAQLDMLTAVDVVGQQALLTEKKQVDKELTTAMASVKAYESEYAQLEKALTKSKAELLQLESNRCPYCLQEYHDTQVKIDQTVDGITTIQQRLTELDVELDTLGTTIDTLLRSSKDLKARITIDNIEELIEIHAESGNIKKRIDELADETNPYLDPLDELVNMPLEAVDYGPANELTTLLDHQKFLLKLLTKRDSFVRKDLLDKNIPYLNARLQHHLSFMGLPHKVEFTHEMTASITQFGQSLDFGNLSAGQRARVNFALSLAFRDVLQQLHQRVNICLFDEVLDIGLDSVGILAAAHLLKRIAKDDEVSAFIISHKSEIENMFDSTVTIQLSKGFSYIKEG